MNKTKLTILLIGIFFIVGLLGFSFNKESKKESKTKINDDLIARQTLMDNKISDYMASSLYTIENPKILINPYEISPLTALLIFKTSEKTSVKVYINGEFYMTTTSTKEHSIPLVGLVANKENDIKVVNDKKSYNYKINLPINGITDKLDIKVKNDNYKDYYLTSSSTSSLLYSAFNSKGELTWHLDMPSQGMIKPLPNGNFIVPAEEFVKEYLVANFTSLYEINYLGKIIKRYDTKLKYHHDLQVLSDNTLMILGSKNAKTSMSVVYRMDLATGKIIDSVDFHEVFKSIDPEWDKKSENFKYGYGINSIDYDETTKNLLISFRCLNLVMSYNYENKEINWMFTGEKEFESFSEYLLTPVDGLEYPLGQHQARLLNDRTISIFNNDFDQKNAKDFLMGNHHGVAKAQILRINEYNKTISLVKEHVEENNKYSFAFGGFVTYPDSNLVNYSYLFDDDAIKNNENMFESGNKSSTRVVEYDNFGNIIFEAGIKDRLYRFIKHDFNISNKPYVPEEYKYFSNFPGVLIDMESLENAPKYDNILKLYKNHFEVNISDELIDELIVIFKGDKTISVPYITSSTYFALENGNYDVYIKLNGKYYNINTKITVK